MRVLAINDISCVGRCSLTVTLPIVSACGVECNVLPTAILSTHPGGFSGYTFQDLTEHIPDILQHWKSLGIKFDYICSGYLGSISQIETVLQIKKEFLFLNFIDEDILSVPLYTFSILSPVIAFVISGSTVCALVCCHDIANSNNAAKSNFVFIFFLFLFSYSISI